MERAVEITGRRLLRERMWDRVGRMKDRGKTG